MFLSRFFKKEAPKPELSPQALADRPMTLADKMRVRTEGVIACQEDQLSKESTRAWETLLENIETAAGRGHFEACLAFMVPGTSKMFKQFMPYLEKRIRENGFTVGRSKVDGHYYIRWY